MNGESEHAISKLYGLSLNWLSERLARDYVFSNALYEAQRAELRRGASIGIRVLIELASEDAKTEAGKKIKLEASKALAQYAGHSGQAAGSGAKAADKPVEEMSIDEIEAKLAEAKRKAGDNARTIDATPDSVQVSAQETAQEPDLLS